MTSSQSKRATAYSRQRTRKRSSMNARPSRIAAARESGSVPSERSRGSSGSRSSGVAPTGVPTTGVPVARASAVTIPKPSYATVGRTKRSAARYQSCSSSSGTSPTKRTRCPSPSSSLSRRRSSLSSPPPTTASATSSSSSLIAPRSCSRPMRGSARRTVTSRRWVRSRSSRARAACFPSAGQNEPVSTPPDTIRTLPTSAG